LQGCGAVGYHLARLVHADGARLTCTDIDPQRVERVVDELGARAVGTDEIYDVAADVFAPCALGAVLNDATIPRLQVEIIAGGANNQLAEDRHGDLLEGRHITYAPDYVINGGGLINVNAELHGWAPERARSKAGEIYDTLQRVFEIAREEGIPSYQAADRLAEQRIAAIAQVRRNFV
jgi:leucine dehydrogenase